LAIDNLETTLGLRFKDQGLLHQALVHRSYLNEQGGSPLDSYERMEFLGDAVLGLVISAELYRRLPQLSEGELTKGRAALVCRESLSQVAQRLGLGNYLLLGKGEESTGGRERDSILAAVFESLVAAIYLDQGQDQAQQFILQVMEEEVRDFCQQGASPENPKSQLQEHLQSLGAPAPHYQTVAKEGPDHTPVFTVEVLKGDEVIGAGRGSKKSDAERAAARDALARLAGESGMLEK
jgi:ribonuclease-3